MESKIPNSQRQPMFADLVVVPLGSGQSDSSRENRSRYMKLMYRYPERFALCGLPVVKVGIGFDAETHTLGDWIIEKQ